MALAALSILLGNLKQILRLRDGVGVGSDRLTQLVVELLSFTAEC